MTATRRAGNVSPLLVLPLLLCLLAAVTGCTAQQQHRPSVVVTTNILGDLTRNVVGDEAEVTVPMQPGADPHSFGVSAPQAAAMEQADLLVHNGLGLEENVLRHVEAARDSGVPTLAVGESVDPMTYTGGESAGQPDPHFWTDPVRVREAVRLLSDRVVRHVEGVDAAAVEKNAERYGEELAGLHDAMRDAFGSVPADRRRLVTNHHVFGYLADRYGFRVVGAVIPSGTTLA
ncbi:metal ABC transporter solute-binding protein, Zn/Mn family, partial [Streptomyces albidoflavus]